MDRLLILPLTLFSTSLLHAQAWCPPGATWTYEALHDNGGFIRQTYTGDTLIDGFTAHMIDRFSATQYAPEYGEPEYAYEAVASITRLEGNAVMQYDDGAWDTLYHFAAEAGDVFTGPFTSCYFYVSASGSEVFDGVALQWVSIGPIHRIYERIGYTWHIELTCPGDIILDPAALRCYSDDEISVQFGSTPCEALVGIGELHADQELRAFPNPGEHTLWLQLPPGPHRFTATDALGRAMTTAIVHGPVAHVDVSSWATGTYLLHMENGSRLRWTKH